MNSFSYSPRKRALAVQVNPLHVKAFLFLVFAQWVLLPSHIQRIDFRSFSQAKPLTISLRRTSPPVSILEDAFSQAESLKPAETVDLKSGGKRQSPQSQKSP